MLDGEPNTVEFSLKVFNNNKKENSTTKSIMHLHNCVRNVKVMVIYAPVLYHVSFINVFSLNVCFILGKL